MRFSPHNTPSSRKSQCTRKLPQCSDYLQKIALSSTAKTHRPECALTLVFLQSVIITGLNPQGQSNAVQSKLAFLLGHECVLHPDSLAKYVATFFTTSRFSLALLSSDLNREISELRITFSSVPTPGCALARLATGTGFCQICPVAWQDQPQRDLVWSPS